MSEIENPEITSYSEHIYHFRKKVFFLRAYFYLIITVSILLPFIEHNFSFNVLSLCTILFFVNLVTSLVLKSKSSTIDYLLYIQQFINLALIIMLILFSGGNKSIFVMLFIIEGFFCGILYNLKCILGFLFVVIGMTFYFCISEEGYNYTLLLSVILTLFATVAAFLIIREQDIRRIELISYYVKIQKLNERLIGIGRLRKNFMDIAYHDMKSPLSTVIGFLQNILAGYGGPITDKQQDWLNRCVDRLDALSKQVNDLYFLANIESTDFNELKKRCDITQELELAIAELSEKFSKKEQKFIKHIPAALPWMIVVPILFRQCISNLLGNASKYTPIGGTIQLDVKYDENWLTVIVSDNGIGIPDEFKPRIFDEFFRVKNVVVDNRKVSGTGLGLTIVKSIVDGHGGTIEVKDNIPYGTVFIVKFPMIKEYKEA
ncbi:MAG: sensor histidine kinase [Myxococcota bacterium]